MLGVFIWIKNSKFNRTSLDPMDMVVLIISIGSEGVLLNLELLIHINTHSRMEINL